MASEFFDRPYRPGIASMAVEFHDLLRVLSELDEEILVNVYDITRDSNAPLDKAVYAWRDAGFPGLVRF